MAANRLSVEEMSEISRPWVTAGSPARIAIEQVPVLNALMPIMEAAHSAVVEAVLASRPATLEPKERALASQAVELDLRHDDLIRGIHGSLTSLALVSPGKSELLALRDWLFPDGLGHTQKTFRAEAGHAGLIRLGLNADMRSRLAAVQLHGSSLMALVEEWMDIGEKLGKLEEQRGSFATPSSTAQGAINAARLAWIKAINALIANAVLADLPPATDQLLFGAFRLASKKSDLRSRGTSKDDHDPEPDPDPGVQASAGNGSSSGAGTGAEVGFGVD